MEWAHVGHATEDLRAKKIDLDDARNVERQAADKLAALKTRAAKAPPLVYADEIGEAEDLMAQLRAAIAERDTKVICIFERAARTTQPPDGPFGYKFPAGRLPHLKVVRLGQTAFIELDGRHRVRDWWGLLVDGVLRVEGPKRWIMKNAQGAALMNAFGVIDPRMFLTGRARMGANYRRRRDRRRLERARHQARERTRRTGKLHVVGADVRIELRMDGHPVVPITSFEEINGLRGGTWEQVDKVPAAVDGEPDPAAG